MRKLENIREGTIADFDKLSLNDQSELSLDLILYGITFTADENNIRVRVNPIYVKMTEVNNNKVYTYEG